MKIKCVVVDDEKPARDELIFFLSKIDCLEICGEAGSVSQAFDLIKEKEPDLIFLDIEMPGNNGFFLLETIKEFKKFPYIVFATAYESYAVEAFEKEALDYVLKPFSFERINESVNKAKKRLENKINEKIRFEEFEHAVSKIPGFSKIPLESDNRIILVSPDEIFFFESLGKDIKAFLYDDVYLLPGEATMEKLEKRLYWKGFFRTHRSFIVNMDKISEFYPMFAGKYELVVKNRDKTKIPVSRARVKEFKKMTGL
ncbi:MAG: response regulator transcription factor [Desulfobacteraceae bacterium]|nr:response regulator transcription factor [Desulfobacteraceae bacterium]MCB9494794.1 response regulator transcription factor [Desulfobacteraceae bacterium]